MKEDNDLLGEIKKLYIEDGLSWDEVGVLLKRNPSSLRKWAKRRGVESRSKEEAQRIALEKGRATHPTKGKKLSEETKIRISESQGLRWDNMSQEDIDKMSQMSKDLWNNMPEDEKAERIKKATSKIRDTTHTGSKLENFIHESLLKEGYKISFHKKHILKNGQLELDMLLDDYGIVIEVDGPSHFEPVWGEDKLKQTQDADREKNGLIIASNLKIIRVQQKQKVTQRYMRHIWNELVNVLSNLSTMDSLTYIS